MGKTAIIAGATGLVGNEVLKLLIKSDHFDKVIAITRRELTIDDAKLISIVTSFEKLEEHADRLKGDTVFCCLGTTIKKAGTKEKFRKVDFDYPLKLAELTKAHGASSYLLISAMGANKNSSVFYNRVKGEIEEAIKKVDFDTYHILRPSLLMGERKEARVGEDAAKKIFKVFGFLFVGPLKKYKAVRYDDVAAQMVLESMRGREGVHIIESKEMLR